MLTFLKKIRKTLILSGSTRKYLLYAIGEITLVVIGILIAIQINNLYEQRKNEETRQVYLKSLITELEGNINLFNNRQKDFDERIESFDHLFSQLNNEKINKDSLKDAQNKVVEYIGIPAISTIAFQELITSNNFQLFEKELRESILLYQDEIAMFIESINIELEETRYFRKIYWQSIDMAFSSGFKNSESTLVRDWASNPNSQRFLNATNFYTKRRITTENFKFWFERLSEGSQTLKVELESLLEE